VYKTPIMKPASAPGTLRLPSLAIIALLFPIFLSLTALRTCAVASAQSKEIYLSPATKPMTVNDVIRLFKAGLSDDLIIEQIKKKGQSFDLSTDQLIQLKAAKVSERVIAVMIDPTGSTQPAPVKKPVSIAPPASVATAAPATPSAQPALTETRQAEPPSSVLPTEIGVYVKEKGTWNEILPEVVNWKTGGVVKSTATVGIVKGDVNGHVNGATSRNQLTNPLEFLIVVPEGTAITEYQLLQLHRHDSDREFRSVTGGVFHVSGGATRDLMPFAPSKVAPRAYTVSMSTALREYGFLPPGAYASANAASSGKIYSFSVIE